MGVETEWGLSVYVSFWLSISRYGSRLTLPSMTFTLFLTSSSGYFFTEQLYIFIMSEFLFYFTS